MEKQKVYIVSAKRTPIGSLLGSLSSIPGTTLCSLTISSILSETKINPSKISEVIIGNVLSTGLGQNPARQVSIKSGVNKSVPCYSVNKVCASGMKSICLGFVNIMCGISEIVICGGFESMSNAPYFIKKGRKGNKFGNFVCFDSVLYDGLKDAYNDCTMGYCAEKTAKDFEITREMQDEFCLESYRRALNAQKNGLFLKEIIPVKTKKGLISLDEEPMKFKKEKIIKLRPVFPDKNGFGTITGGNASKLNDGACSFLLMSESSLQKTENQNLKPIAEIISFADAETDPVDFNISPSLAVKKVLKNSNLKVSDIDFWEFNEAFSVTGLVNMKILGIDNKILNVNGGAVSLGHPLGMSGARVVQSLISVLKQHGGEYGCAAICNGGGGSTAIIVRNFK